MNDNTPPPAGNDSWPPGMRKYFGLLEDWDETVKAEQAAAYSDDPDAVRRAQWAVAEKMGAINKFKEDEATYLLMRLQWAAELFPLQYDAAITQARSVTEIADTVAALQEQEVPL